MILYTTIPPEIIFGDYERENNQQIVTTKEGVKLLVEMEGTSWGKVIRVLSTKPTDFLDTRFQPGSMINLSS